MRDFRLDRIARIGSGDIPVPLLNNCCLVLHIIPFSHFDLGAAPVLTRAAGNPGYFPPIATTSPASWRVNLEGFLTLSNVNEGRHRAYVQVFRSGAVEAVASSIDRSDGHIPIQRVDFLMVQSTRIYAMALHECGAEPPLTVMASVIGVKGEASQRDLIPSRVWKARSRIAINCTSPM
jgi:hypothetical protein